MKTTQTAVLVKKAKFPAIYFGWWTVITGGVLSFWGQGISLFGFSALFKPIASELGFNRAVTSVAASIGRLEGGIEGPVLGWVIDRFGPKWPFLFGVFFIGLGLILMYFIDSLWAFYLVWGVIVGTGTNIAFGVPLEKAITDWFVKKRGLALSVRWLFTAFAAVIMLPLIAWLIVTQGWRTTCLIAGIVMLVIGLPMVAFLVKQHRPEYYGMLPDGVAMGEENLETSKVIDRGVRYAKEVQEIEFTLGQSMRTPAYWLLLLANAAFGLVSPVFLIHAVPFLTDMGIDPVKAAVMLGLMASSSIPGTLFIGLIADRFRRQNLRFLLVLAYTLPLIGVAAFLLSPSLVMIYPLFILYHFGSSTTALLNSLIRARYFGRKAFGSIRGTSAMFIMPFSIVAPIYAGWVYDTTGSYKPVFIVLAALLAFATLTVALSFPPKAPAQVTDIHKIF